MCIGVPSRVVAVDGLMARVESLGQQRDVSLILMEGPVELGDYLLIQVGNFAAEKIDPQHAQDALDLLAELDMAPARSHTYPDVHPGDLDDKG